MTSVLQDIHYAFRTMRRNAGVTAVAVLSLAIGIGPNAAIFSVIDAIGLRPLAIRDADRLVRLDTLDARNRAGDTSYPDFVDIRAAATQLRDIAASGLGAAGVSGTDQPAAFAMTSAVSERFFPMLGVTAAAGRLFRADEATETTAARVALLSDDYWRRRFNRSPEAINATIRLNTTDYTIVGVLPASFRGLDTLFNPDVWVPLGAEPGTQRSQMGRDRGSLRVVARLRDGTTLQQAQAELDALSAHLAKTYPASNGSRKLAIQFEEAARRSRTMPMAIALLVIPCLVLLIACANVAGLLIGRASSRRGEVAVRLALGAGRRRLVRQFLTESAILGLAAAGLGLVLGYVLIRLLPALIPPLPIRLGIEFRLDARVTLLTLVVALIAVPVFGLAPAFFASKPAILPMLKGEEPAGGRFRRLTFRNALTVAQIAGSLVLLMLSGLLVRSFLNSSAIDTGFVKKPMILSTMAPAAIGYDRQQSAAFLRRLLERLSAQPSVEAATLARHMPLNSMFGGGGVQKVSIPGRAQPDGEPLRIAYNIVEENYFTTLGTRIIRGRAFTPADRWPGTGAVLVNETMAARFWPGDDAIGRWIDLLDRQQPEQRRCQIAGIVQDAKYLRLAEEPMPYLYLPFGQQPAGEVTVIVRTRGPEAAAMDDFRRVLRELDPAMPAMAMITLREHLRMALMFERVAAIVVGTLGSLALLLSIVGLYGVISYVTSRRTREIGIRMALGARPGDVVRQIVKQGGGFAGAGIGVGLVVGSLAARLVASVLHGVSSYDPVTYVSTCAVVMIIALAATSVPAWKAARIDPIRALRSE